MKRAASYVRHSVTRKDRPDGSIILRSNHRLGPVADTTGQWVHHWANHAPDRVFLAERSGAGWRQETFGSILQKTRAIAQSLLARGMGPDTPILILSGNGVDHGLLTLAAQYIGVPTVPVAEQYSLIQGAEARLRQVIELVRPKMVFVADADQFANALALPALAGVEIVASRCGQNTRATKFDHLLKGDAGVDVDAAHAQITPDTIAKILMTSGSTSAPKGVLTTQRMMCVNQTQIADALPFLRARPPRIVDWLPWNHVFGGSHNFNMMLAFGGSLYIDEGKPTKGLFGRSLENLSMVTGTLAFNVPVGFSMLLAALRQNETLKRRFFQGLDLVFYAGASLPQDVWAGFEEMANEVKGEVPLITASWGLTETAPATMMQQEPTQTSGVVGVPLNGVTVKLIPEQDGRCEVRVKGPNVTQGYFADLEKTKKAFDDEGFFITGDAMVFVDPDDANKGMRFDGRISEDFKLQTGTWVRTARLRAEMLACLAPLAADVVITGQDRHEIGVMIFPDRDATKAAGFAEVEHQNLLICPLMLAEIQNRLRGRLVATGGASTRITRGLVLAEPPSLRDGEITAKGNLNFGEILRRRAGLLQRLYDDADPCIVNIGKETT